MKKFILYFLSLIILTVSCDKIYTNKLFITNNCEVPIHISITDTYNNVDAFNIAANSTFMFDEGSGIMSPKGVVEKGFVKFEVFKNGIKSKVNYKDFNRWYCIQGKDKYHSEIYLTINPEDFE